MRVNFVTSGFPNGFTEAFIRALTIYLPSDPKLVFVASDFSLHQRTEQYLRHFEALFSEKGIRFHQSKIVDYRIHADEAIGFIQAADVVWLAGGSTLTQIRQIKEYNLIPALRERVGITIGMSAGSINMAKQVVLAKDLEDEVPELSVYEGIGLVDFNIEPHIDHASEEHLEDVRVASKIAPIYGLCDESFILELDGDFTVFGQYRLFE